MERDELKKLFHALFNKVNNILMASASNKRLLEEEDTDKLSSDELKKRITDLIEVLARIEENAETLSASLQEFYGLLTKEQPAS